MKFGVVKLKYYGAESDALGLEVVVGVCAHQLMLMWRWTIFVWWYSELSSTNTVIFRGHVNTKPFFEVFLASTCLSLTHLPLFV